MELLTSFEKEKQTPKYRVDVRMNQMRMIVRISTYGLERPTIN